MRRLACIGASVLLLAGCGSETAEENASDGNAAAQAEQTASDDASDEDASTDGDADERAQAETPDDDGVREEIGTPMAERVATIGLLNKRNNLSRDIEMKPGEARRFGDVIVRLSACERTAPWEMPAETGAFVQLLVRQRGEEDQFLRVFSGWLFKNSPSVNVVEHPIYDVWVKDCAMSFPGEEAPTGPSLGDESDDEDDSTEA